MEENKVKINLSTLIFLGIVITLIIVGLVGYILKISKDESIAEKELKNNIKTDEIENIISMSEEIINYNESIDEENISNEIATNESIDKIIEYEEWDVSKLKNNIVYAFDDRENIGKKYMQFENNLFSIYNASLGVLPLEPIENLEQIIPKKILYDLNCDNEEEEIIIDILEDGYSFKENGKEFYKSEVNSYVKIYIVDLNEKDEKVEIIIEENENSTVYVRSDVQMRATLKNITGLIMTDKNGVICTLDKTTSNISPSIFLEHYITENGLITLKRFDLDDLKDTLFYVENSTYTGIYFTTDLDGMRAQSYEIIPKDIDFEYDEKYVRKLDENTKFYIIGIIESNGESKYDLKVKLLDGTEGYIYHKDGYLNAYKFSW